MQVTVKNKKPPRSLLKKIRGAGMDPDLTKTVFTYGSTIYNPGGEPLPKDLIEHEKVHTRQQGDNPKAWWDRYINDAQFRLEQEMEAYIKQYKVICQRVKGKEQRHNVIMDIASYLSGPTYGNLVSKMTIYSKIKEQVKNY